VIQVCEMLSKKLTVYHCRYIILWHKILHMLNLESWLWFSHTFICSCVRSPWTCTKRMWFRKSAKTLLPAVDVFQEKCRYCCRQLMCFRKSAKTLLLAVDSGHGSQLLHKMCYYTWRLMCCWPKFLHVCWAYAEDWYWKNMAVVICAGEWYW
jgi:hypothetical protein